MAECDFTHNNFLKIYHSFYPLEHSESEIRTIFSNLKNSILEEWECAIKDVSDAQGDPEAFVGTTRRPPYRITLSIDAKNIPHRDRVEALDWAFDELLLAYARVKNYAAADSLN